MSTVKKLQLLMTADASQVQKAAANMESSLKRVEGAVGRMNAGMLAGMGALTGSSSPVDLLKGMASSLMGSIPGIGPVMQQTFGLVSSTVEAVWQKVRDTQQAILDVGRSAAASGADVQRYSLLLYATGGNAEMLNKSLFKLSEKIGDAAYNGGEAAEAFERLGLNVKELSGMETTEQFLKFAEALAKIESPAERAAIAFKVFGKSAHEIMPELMKGVDALRARMEKGEMRGLGISNEDLAAVRQADRAMKDLAGSTESAWRQVTIGLSPAIKEAAKDLDSLRGGKDGGFLKDIGGNMLLMTNVTKEFWKTGKIGLDEFGRGFLKTQQQMENFDASVKKDAAQMSHWARAIEIASNQAKQLKADQEAANEEVKAATEYFKEANKILEANESPWQSFIRQQEMARIELDKVNGSLEDQVLMLGHLAEKILNISALQKGTTGASLLEFGGGGAAEAMNRFEGAARQPDFTQLLEQAREQSEIMRGIREKLGEAAKGILGIGVAGP